MDVVNALLLDDLVVFGADASAAEGVSIRDSVVDLECGDFNTCW